MHNKSVVVFILCALLLSSCSSNDKKTLGGERIAVLQYQNDTASDAAAKDVKIALATERQNSDWTQPIENAGHSPLNLSLSPSKLRKIWNSSIGTGSKRDRKLITAPIVVGNHIFAADTNGNIALYDLKNGQRGWKVHILPKKSDDATVSSGLASDGKNVYATDGFTSVLALDINTGKTLWKQTLDQPLRGSPSVEGNRLFVITLNDETIALDTASGGVLWRHEGVQETASLLGAPSPAVQDSVVITTYSSGDVAALRAETGSEAWTDNLNGAADGENRAVTQLAAFRAQPVLDQNIAYVGNASSRFVAIQVSSGERLWQKEFGLLSTPWVSGNMVFAITAQNNLLALVKDTGQTRWSTDLPHYEDTEKRKDPIFWQGPMLAGGRLLVFGSNEKMLEVNPQTGAVTATTELSGKIMVPPVIAQKTLIVVTDNGEMAAYQ